MSTPAAAQTDDFNSGTLGPGWASSVSSNYPGEISFPADPYGGKAIRLVATNGHWPVGGDQDGARLMLWRTDRLYTNFYVAVDVLGWDTSIQRSTNRPLIALMARLTNVVRDASVPVGRPDGMIFWLNVNRFGGSPQGTRGVINLGHITDGQPGSPFDTLGLQGDFTVDPGHAYRLVFTGTNLVDEFGNYTNGIYHGRVYDLQDLTRPLAHVYCPDPFPGYGGFLGNPIWGAPGYSGIASVADGTTNNSGVTFHTTDVTFDNFVASEFPPTSVSFPGTPNGEVGVPQVVNRTPASYANFYAPTGGINFTATTLGGSDVTGVKLFLNGVDVSASLSISPVSNSRTVSYPGSGLTSNTVYDARIELQNALGQKTTNVWTFDTFTDAYLASAACKIIECEDFDFGGGQFIDNPVASGFDADLSYYNNSQVLPYPWTGATNQDLGGPPYTSYVNKGTTNDLAIDYWDVDSKTREKQVWEADFRPLFRPAEPGRCPGTTEGCPSYVYYLAYPPPSYPLFTGENPRHHYDTRRQKYVDLGPNIQEYMLERLEGGEWYNYTRIFSSANYYHVYLRHGAEFTMQLRLDRIVPGSATNKLGEFYTTNALGKSNFRYATLLDESGKPVLLNLSGTNTLRLTVDVPQEERTKQGLMLNYLAFVPALAVESSAQADTGYAYDSTAVIEPITKTITLPQNGSTRFYRLRWDRPTSIKSVSAVGGNVVLTYQ